MTMLGGLTPGRLVASFAFVGCTAVAQTTDQTNVTNEDSPFVSGKGHDGWSNFLRSPEHRAFVLSSTKGWGWASGHPTPESALALAIKNCEKYGLVCAPYAVNQELVWRKSPPIPISTSQTSIPTSIVQKMVGFDETEMSSRTDGPNWGSHSFSLKDQTYTVKGYTTSTACFSARSRAIFTARQDGAVEIYAPFRSTLVKGCPAISAIVDFSHRVLYVWEVTESDTQGPYLYRPKN
jgi:hypothetical protein